MTFGISGSSAKQKSNSSFNETALGGPQWDQFYGNLNNQWGASQPNLGLTNQYVNNANPYMTGAANTGQAGSAYMSGGGSFGDTSGMRNSLYSSIQDSMANPSQTGKMYESIVGGAGNTYVDPLVASMRQSGNQALDRSNAYNAADASNYGQSGGSRQAMQNAMNTRMANQDMAGQENALRAGAYDKDLNWKMSIAQQADLGRGQAQDRGMAALQGADANRQFGMGYQPTMQNLGMGTMAPWMQGMMMPWQMANMYATSMGNPTTLGSGTSTSKGSSMSGGFGF